MVGAVALHLDVALVAPPLAPRVLDQPVAGAVSHHQHPVVQVLKWMVSIVLDMGASRG